MATLGKTTTPTSSTHGWIASGGKQVGMLFTVPSGGGVFSSVTFWAAGDASNNVPIYGMIWDSSGNVLASGAAVSTSGGSRSNPGGDGNWHTSTFSTAKFIAGGTQVYIGWQPSNGSTVDWAYNGNDHSPDAQQASHYGSPTSFSGHGTESPTGAVAAYATYAPVSAPTLTGISPDHGIGGDVITLTGTQFSTASSVKFNGISASFTIVDGSHITATVPAGSTTGNVTVTNPDGTSGGQTFTQVLTPTISSLSPDHGLAGDSVTIVGTNFTYATSVKFNGVTAAFSITNDTHITATAPVGVSTGLVSVTNEAGTGYSPSSWKKVPVPTVTSFSPTVGPVGTSVAIAGTGFTYAMSVKFNGVSSASVTIVDDTHIAATVPASATSGTVSVTTVAGTGTSAGSFLVGTLYGDNSAAFVGGVLIYGDSGIDWELGQVWADNGTTWIRLL